MTSVVAGVPRLASAELRVVGVMWWRELIRWRRDRSQIFGALSRTVLWLVILGVGLGAILREIEGYSYAQYILPGVITLNILFASLQSAIALVWDRQVGLMREVLVSPASMFAVALGKICGGATVAVLQGAIALAVAPLIGVALPPASLLLAFRDVRHGRSVHRDRRGHRLPHVDVRGFGGISNGVIQPLYFLSGAIFPLKGVIGGVGFLDIPVTLRAELRRYGINAVGGGWAVTLRGWLKALVYCNPVRYLLDLLRFVTLGYSQLPIAADLVAVFSLLPIAVLIAARAMKGLRNA